MTTDPSAKPSKPILNIFIRIVICSVVLVLGVVGMQRLAAFKKPPAEVQTKERPLQVNVVRAIPENVPVVITGYGEAEVLNTVVVSPEVSGKITHVHSRLEVGEIIDKGETLFRIDDSDYQAAHREAQASVEQLRYTILRLEKQYEIDRHRLKTIQRSRDLAEAEFNRIRKLFDTGKVVARSRVDSAEQQYNAQSDLTDQMSQAVEMYPLRIKETESSLSAAIARETLAIIRLKRCVVRTPFKGRVKSVNLETGQYVSPGIAAVILADDSVLEIKVPLDSRDARQWLMFDGHRQNGRSAWFNELKPVACRVKWTEDPDKKGWKGRLHRVVAFNQQNRTLTVAIRIEAPGGLSVEEGALPLVEGMFCSVEIPGQTLQNVFRLPRWAVSFRNTIYVSEKSRLKTRPVKIARVQGEEAIVSEGIQPGDMVVITRLIDPLENSLLEINR